MVDVAQIDADGVYELLEAADMFLLPGLKRQCGAYLGSQSSGILDVESAVGLVRTARLYDMPRLEHQCVEFMATNIDKVLKHVLYLKSVGF